MSKRVFLNNINYLRGVAIFCVMAVHVWVIPTMNVEQDPIYLKLVSGLREVLFHDSTIFFVFISGFLFEYLSSKFTITSYFKSKLQNVLIPFIFLSTIIYTYQIVSSGSQFFIKDFFLTIINGKAQTQYWYIPFIFIIFLISPLLLRIPKSKLILLLPLIAVIPLFGTRTGTTLSIGQYLYFLPVYILGLIFSANYQRFFIFLEKKLFVLFILIIGSTGLIILAKLYEPYNISINLYESSHYLQKMFILLFLIVFLKKVDHKGFKALDVLAKYSFPLFFTHNLVHGLIHEKFYSLVTTSNFIIFPISIFYTLMIISISLLLCISIKKVFGHCSKYIIGA